MKGRKNKPTALKVLAGNPGKRPLPKEIDVPPAEVAMPPELKGKGYAAARREWKRIAPLLSDAGVMKETDRTALIIYCQTWQRYLDAEEDFRREGMFHITPNLSVQVHPAHSIMRGALDQIMKLMLEFGLTPSSRTRVKGEKPPAENPLEKLMGSAGKR